MKSHLTTAALITLVLIVAACAPAPEQPAAEAPARADDVAVIDSLREEFVTVFNANEASRLAALYSEDGVLMPPNQPAAVANQAIEAWFQGMFDQFTAELTLSSEEVEVTGDRAFRRGVYTIKLTPKADGEPTEDNGKYMEILQRQPDGSWKITHDIWNSDKPLPGTGG